MSDFKPYRAISALAGSGKTYTLTSRYIALLALGFAPQRIMAITFTRKAAGEIFDRIVTRLAGAAMSEDRRGELQTALRDQLGDDQYVLPPDAPARWLMIIVEAMNDLRIGTMDSFFSALVRAFAFELGLPPRQELLEGATLDAAREEALDHAFELLARDEAGRDAFREAFKLATSDKSRFVRDAIHKIIQQDHKVYLEEPDGEAWGNRKRIWKDGDPWWFGAPENPAALAARIDDFMTRHVESTGHPAGYKKAWHKIADALKAGDWDDALDGTLPGRLIDAREKLARGFATITFSSKDYTLAGPDAAGALAFLAAAAKGLIERILGETSARWRLLNAYDRSFHAEMRQRGRLTFADVPLLLSRMCAENVKLDIDYRMDSRIDHWMIDEFQDTNLRQWQIIGRLADEVLQSSEANRSFFYVGDVKQAIYRWRGGESNLFEAVREYYGSKFGEAGKLDTSWRSSPVILDFVNEAFGHIRPASALATHFPRLVEKWQHHWQTHKPAEKNRELPGRVEWHKIEAKQEVGGLPGRIFLAVRMVKDLLEKNVDDICVLVRTNAYGDEVAKALRSAGVSVRRETKPRLLDNPAVSGLLSMLSFADHPDEDFAWPHLGITPLRAVLMQWAGLEGRSGETKYLLAARLREVAARRGIAGLLGEVIDACRQAGLLGDDFSGLRMRQLLDAAAEFDRTLAEGPSRFAERAATLEATDPGADGRVVVMTMHKAKGLEFDAVVLPELQGSAGQWNSTSTGDLKIGGIIRAEQMNPAERIDQQEGWVLPSPKKEVVALDETMAEFSRSIMANRAGDEMCLLYVAVTRARHYLYLITEELNEDSEVLNSAKFLEDGLAPHAAEFQEHFPGLPSALRYAAGDPVRPVKNKTREANMAEAAVTKLPAELFTGGKSAGLRRLMMRTPSGEEKAVEYRSARLLFGAGKTSGSSRGTILHDLFSRVAWLTPGAEKDAIAGYEAEFGVCPDEIKQEFIAALASKPVAALMARPSVAADVWREQAFELAEGGRWISGRVDRVMIEQDDQGRMTAATVIDFKSDRINEENTRDVIAARYAPQIELYRRVVARITGLDEQRVAAKLVLTRTGEVLG